MRAFSYHSIALDADSKIPLMLLTDLEEKFFLPIYIGVFEARAIGMELEGMNSPRPFTHDLLKTILDHFNGSIRRVVINDLQESTYFARIVLLRGEQEIEIDARPSDAVAMALRFKAPIFVTENVVIEAATPEKDVAAPSKASSAAATSPRTSRNISTSRAVEGRFVTRPVTKSKSSNVRTRSPTGRGAS